MLKIIGARENIDKERFIYENISGEALVIVPNQYTLVAEEQALKYLGRDCLFDVEILSMNRLGLRVLTEKGRESVRMLDKYGRFMLLNRIIKKHRDELNIYSNSVGKISFTEMVNDFILDFKQQNCSIEKLKSLIADSEADVLMKAKLSELEIIIEEYERSIEGKYTDSEDYIAMYVEAIRSSELIKNKSIWIYAYDSITPKFINAMFELARLAENVNFILNRSDFGLDTAISARLISEARERAVEYSCEEIGEEYLIPKSETIERIEARLWNDAVSGESKPSSSDYVPSDLKLVRAANPYYEAETAAAYICSLLRDHNYKMRDIQIIANDEAVMQPIIRRCFEEYGLPLFMDRSRTITDAAVVSFIVNQLWFTSYGGGTGYLIAMLKSGFAGVDYEQVEALENYARQYKIKGSMWFKPFKYGAEACGEQQFMELENTRQRVLEPLTQLKAICDAEKVSDFVDSFKQYLEQQWSLSTQLEDEANVQLSEGFSEEAQRSVQSYRKALELLDQMVEIMGDEEFRLEEFTDIYVAGLSSVELGVIPPSADGLSLGTMIRTRPRPAKAVLVLGANEGVLPLQPSVEGLFSLDEKRFFRDRDFALGSLDDQKQAEENVAMYRMLSKPSEKLYVSWSMSDADGKESTQSTLVDALLELFPSMNSRIEKDIISAGWNGALSDFKGLNPMINTEGESLKHLIGHIKNRNTAADMDPQTEALLCWFEKHSPEKLELMLRLAQDENNPSELGRGIASELYARRDGNIVLSASALSSYFDCPFKYFIDNGLRPREEREFSGDSRSIGDVYHECLMRVARLVLDDRVLAKELLEDDERLAELISQQLEIIAEEYNDGLFISCGNEEFHLGRIKEICSAAAKAVALQLASEQLEDACFEESFGRGRSFKPIEIDIDGQKLYIEGKIDRTDFLKAEDGSRVRIIDYKTGSDSLNLWKMRNGYKMQLMIYMLSASDSYEPAGMFYFNIKDEIENYNNKDEKYVKKDGSTLADRKPEDSFRLNGVYLDEEGVPESMPMEALGKASSISRAAYEELKADVCRNIEKLSEGIIKGRIGINPLKNDNKLVCRYCRYKSICKRDREYMLNAAREIAAEPKKKDKEGRSVGGH